MTNVLPKCKCLYCAVNVPKCPLQPEIVKRETQYGDDEQTEALDDTPVVVSFQKSSNRALTFDQIKQILHHFISNRVLRVTSPRSDRRTQLPRLTTLAIF